MLTKSQIEILKKAQEKGHISISECLEFYSTKEYLKNAIERLVSLGYLKISAEYMNRYDYTGKEFEKHG